MTTARSAWGSLSPSRPAARGRLGALASAPRLGARRRWALLQRLAPFLLALLLLGTGALAQSPASSWRAGDFEAAHAAAAAINTAPMQLLAARAAADQAVYVLAPVGAELAEQLAWLRRSVAAAERAVELAPTSAEALIALARGRGEIARRSGILQNLNVASELRSLFDEALKLEPENADALVALAMWHLELVQNGVGWLYGGRQGEVLPLAERGVAAAPRQVNLRVEYATALRALGSEEEARRQLEVALALDAATAVDLAEQRRARELLAAR